MADGSARRPSSPGQPRIIPIYLPGCSTPRLEWVNQLEAPSDYGDFASRTYLPHAWDVDVTSAESVAEWCRVTNEYMRELERLQEEWVVYEEAIEAVRRSISETTLAEHPELIEMLRGYEQNIAENKEMLAAFSTMMEEEIDDIDEAHAASLEEDDE